ncbi:bap31 domain protein [Grosmannia clavigera kw1407]|uniref:Endoplasmic reticulum transmembrane protein n=1 Tax=Grosmannia clavigera (strain kw1407 / UAMH 11150) TaxID=655863 RepID=F0XAI8_GROCL|nr:bap31 domain protein [Grosmannia clavigera kw1407]EFX05605.1 bap31 domain protein [Grosmannia clavigera kw1407]
MTLYFSLVFALLMAEMGLFLVLITPLPFAAKRKMYRFLSENPVVAKIQYGMKIAFIFILILFVDSANRVYRVQVELSTLAENGNGAAIMGRERLEVQARKFYSQRNMYLCGFTLFLSLILNRTYTLVIEVLRLEEKIKTFEGPAAKHSAKLAAAGDGEVAKLRKELDSKDIDLKTLKKQAEALQREYNELSDKYAATQGSAGPKKTK